MCQYSGPCILSPPIQLQQCGLNLYVVLKQKGICHVCIENTTVELPLCGLKIQGGLKMGGLKLQGPLLYTSLCSTCMHNAMLMNNMYMLPCLCLLKWNKNLY